MVLRLIFLGCVFFCLIDFTNGAATLPYGRLAISGPLLVKTSNGSPVQLHGMSLFWSQWMPQFWNNATIQALKCSWKTNVVRAAMGVESGGYFDHPEVEIAKVFAVIDAAIEAGIYVIVDWHDDHAEDFRPQAVAFFSNVSETYGDIPNIIYETYNEPKQVSWSGVLKPYHTAVIKAIRANAPTSVIIVGTPNWSQYVDEAADDPLTEFQNIAYTLHFYAASHKQELRDRAQKAIDKGLPIFVTEYGTVSSSGDGPVDENETRAWWTFLDRNKISYLNWAIDDKAEGSAALIPGTTSDQVGDATKLTASGKFVKDKYSTQINGIIC